MTATQTEPNKGTRRFKKPEERPANVDQLGHGLHARFPGITRDEFERRFIDAMFDDAALAEDGFRRLCSLGYHRWTQKSAGSAPLEKQRAERDQRKAEETKQAAALAEKRHDEFWLNMQIGTKKLGDMTREELHAIGTGLRRLVGRMQPGQTVREAFTDQQVAEILKAKP